MFSFGLFSFNFENFLILRPQLTFISYIMEDKDADLHGSQDSLDIPRPACIISKSLNMYADELVVDDALFPPRRTDIDDGAISGDELCGEENEEEDEEREREKVEEKSKETEKEREGDVVSDPSEEKETAKKKESDAAAVLPSGSRLHLKWMKKEREGQRRGSTGQALRLSPEERTEKRVTLEQYIQKTTDKEPALLAPHVDDLSLSDDERLADFRRTSIPDTIGIADAQAASEAHAAITDSGKVSQEETEEESSLPEGESEDQPADETERKEVVTKTGSVDDDRYVSWG